MMQNNNKTGLLILILSLCTQTEFSTSVMQQPNQAVHYLTSARYPARASPDDSTQYSIRVKGQSNSIIVNGKVIVATCDTTQKQNNIQVCGEGNTVTIKQTDQQSEVNINQQGKKNQIHIIQK